MQVFPSSDGDIAGERCQSQTYWAGKPNGADRTVLKSTLLPADQREYESHAATLAGLRAKISGSNRNADERSELSEQYEQLLRLQTQVTEVNQLSPRLAEGAGKLKTALSTLQQSRDSLLRGFSYFNQTASEKDKAIIGQLKARVEKATIDDRIPKQYEEQTKVIGNLAAKFAGVKTEPIPVLRWSDLKASTAIPGADTLGPRLSLTTDSLQEARQRIERLKSLLPNSDERALTDNSHPKSCRCEKCRIMEADRVVPGRVRIQPMAPKRIVGRNEGLNPYMGSPPTLLIACWDFGDGKKVDYPTLSTAEHSYSQPGSYTVALRVLEGTWRGGETSNRDISANYTWAKIGEDTINFEVTGQEPDKKKVNDEADALIAKLRSQR